MGVEFLYADGEAGRQTDMMKLAVAFLNFANTPYKMRRESFHFCYVCVQLTDWLMSCMLTRNNVKHSFTLYAAKVKVLINL